MPPLLPDEPLPGVGINQSPQTALWNWIHGIILELDLKGIDKKNRLKQRKPDVTGLSLPCVIISCVDEVINADSGTNERDDWDFGFMVAIVAGNNGYVSDEGMETWYLWRWTIERTFLNCRFRQAGFPDPQLPDTAGGLNRTIVRNGLPWIPEALAKNYDAQSLIIGCTIRGK